MNLVIFFLAIYTLLCAIWNHPTVGGKVTFLNDLLCDHEKVKRWSMFFMPWTLGFVMLVIAIICNHL
jgi:hypothetical protein